MLFLTPPLEGRTVTGTRGLAGFLNDCMIGSGVPVFPEAADHVLMSPRKPRFKSQLSGTPGNTVDFSEPLSGGPRSQSREELTGKCGIRPQQATWWDCALGDSPAPAGFRFIETWDSGGFGGHKSGLLSRHTTWLDACCLGKLVPVLGAHGMLKLNTILLLGKELRIPAAGWPGQAAQIVQWVTCLSLLNFPCCRW